MFPLTDVYRSSKIPFWVIAIILANLYIFLQEVFSPFPELFINRYSLIPMTVDFADQSTLWPFITSQFLHGGFLHIITNMWFLWVFGNNVESKLGWLFFPILYIFSGTVGNFLQYLFSVDSSIPMLGASGAVAGVLGAYFALFPKNKIRTLVIILFLVMVVEIPASFVLFYWFILQLFNGAVSVSPGLQQTGGIAYFAHVGGFVSGWLIGRFLYR